MKSFDGDKQRTAFALWRQGRSYDDIALELGCSRASVGRLLQRERQGCESLVQSKVSDMSQVFKELAETAQREFESTKDVATLNTALRAWQSFAEAQSGIVATEEAPPQNLSADEFLLMAAYVDQRNKDLGLLRSDGNGYYPQALRRYFGFAPGFNERPELPEDLS